MQIDLFERSDLLQDLARITSLVRAREFSCSPQHRSELLQRYPSLSSLVISSREYLQVEEYVDKHFSATEDAMEVLYTDNLFLLEALGIGNGCKQYTTILDFSQSLDYALHRLTGCALQDVRKLNGYDEISDGLLNLTLTQGGLKLKDFYHLSPEIAKFIEKLALDTRLNKIGDASILNSVITRRFFYAILAEIQLVRDYCTSVVRASYTKAEPVWRSYNLSASILSTSSEISDDLIIHQEGCEDYTIPIRSYAKWKYAEEVGL